MGNPGSIKNMLKHIGQDSEITKDIEKINYAEKIIISGVGAFGSGIQNLRKFNLIDVLQKKILSDQIPVLGICLGMQLMTQKSDESTEAGLGWINAHTLRFKFNGEEKKLKVPHMGWNYVKKVKESNFLKQVDSNARYYFVHSYYVHCNEEENKLLLTEYGYEFTSAFQKNNILGVQFHPEKSHKFGMQLLKNFSEFS